MAPVPGGAAGRFVIQDPIARGGMGVVVRALDRDLRRSVALKFMRDDSDTAQRQRFLAEAKITGQLEHPNIVPIHEFGVDEFGRPFFVMKYVQGRSLEQVLKEVASRDFQLRTLSGRTARRAPRSETRSAGDDPDMSLPRLLQVYINVCHAVAFAHSRSVVHRDLKPANVMVGDYGEVLVMDWGLAKPGVAAIRDGGAAVEAEANPNAVPGAPPPGPGTQDGTVSGTPVYMAPEQAAGDLGKIDARTDVYALGAILYEILTLRPPVDGRDVDQVLELVRAGQIMPPDQRAAGRAIPRDLAAIAMKALSRRREDRYQSAQELREDIERYIDGRAVSAINETPFETLVRLARRNRVATVVVALALLLVCALSISNTIDQRRARRIAEANEHAAEEAQHNAEQALAALQAEQVQRQADQLQAAPAFLEAGRKAAASHDFVNANLDARAAIGADPGLADAWLLGGQCLVVLGHYDEALEKFAGHDRLVPGDTDVHDLEVLCREAGAGGATEALKARIAAVFLRQKAWAFADAQFLSLDDRFALCRDRIDAAWSGLGARLTRNAPGSWSLDLDGCSQVDDLAPLAGMPIAVLHLGQTPVRDLAPLSGLPLVELEIDDTRVADLTPLRGGLLQRLSAARSRVSDLAPLNHLPLRQLNLAGAPVRDLAPLAGMTLEWLDCSGCPVGDLSALAGMPLRHLALAGVEGGDYRCVSGMPLGWFKPGAGFTDLTLLANLPLTSLDLTASGVTDLGPIADTTLTYLAFVPGRNKKGVPAVRYLRSLAKISYDGDPAHALAASEFWQKYDAGQLPVKSGR
jgi:serine/threonine protein kinase